ncbi:DinB family protein [Sphaerisporangium perillae]|uniref:DinB family protein n=1 Tax=Sphaerisporangium perillae TaxID=2935860 RepID=UPI00200E289B|nr:DinB family protein [Sphaerisporangium perillae]
MTDVYLELGPKKVFACAYDWPGWCRVGKGEEGALAALAEYIPRYRVIAERAGLPFEPDAFTVVERTPGNSTTDFGAPGAVPEIDAHPVDVATAERGTALVRAAWEVFDEVAAASPEELRKGPRGGGRDRDKMVSHVVEAERSYARQIGVRHRPFAPDDHVARAAMRDEIAGVLGKPSDGSPLRPGGWPARYAARRIAWHVIDHIWEMEDRRT